MAALLVGLVAALLLWTALPSTIAAAQLKLGGAHGDDMMLFCSTLMMRQGSPDIYTPGKLELFMAGTPLGAELNQGWAVGKSIYPPWDYVALSPLLSWLTITPFIHFLFFCNVLCLIATGVALGASVRRAASIGRAPWPELTCIGVVLACCPTAENLWQGQPNLLVLALISATLYFDLAMRPRLAGLTLGLAALVKLFPAFLLLHFLVRRDWPAVRAFFATTVLGVLMTLVLAPELVYFYATVGFPAYGSVLARFAFPLNRTLDGLLAYAHRRSWSPLLKLLKLAAVLLAVQLTRRGPERASAFCLWLACMLLILPSSWQYYDVFFLPALVMGLALARTAPLQLVLGTIWMIVAGNDTRFMMPWRPDVNQIRIAMVESPWAVALKPLLFVSLATLVRATPESPVPPESSLPRSPAASPPAATPSASPS